LESFDPVTVIGLALVMTGSSPQSVMLQTAAMPLYEAVAAVLPTHFLDADPLIV